MLLRNLREALAFGVAVSETSGSFASDSIFLELLEAKLLLSREGIFPNTEECFSGGSSGGSPSLGASSAIADDALSMITFD